MSSMAIMCLKGLHYMYIDSHCHLNHNRLLHKGGANAVVANANKAGVEGMLTISCRIADEFPEILAMTKTLNNVWCTVGTHPHDAGEDAEKAISLEKLIEIARSDDNIVGIGESGLDYYYKNSPVEDQQESFRKHIRACIETDLPLVIHARDADEDVIRILKEEGAGQNNLTGVMHCFSSGRKMGEEALELGFYISFSGIVTFKNAQDLRDFAKDVPLDRILIETDAPYLAPEPFRKEINEPALVVHTSKTLSEIHNLDEQTMATHSKQNFFNLFKKAKLNII